MAWPYNMSWHFIHTPIARRYNITTHHITLHTTRSTYTWPYIITLHYINVISIAHQWDLKHYNEQIPSACATHISTEQQLHWLKRGRMCCFPAFVLSTATIWHCRCKHPRNGDLPLWEITITITGVTEKLDSSHMSCMSKWAHELQDINWSGA